ncbi:MAG: DNA mismatch repair endonuclease MutL [Dehalococcoidia bacterium]
MSQIQELPPALINKIAAGEVIERPASIVKELVENALDAGAGRIDMTLEDGGARLIRVTDDGCGIAPEELPLAVAAHATSKIYTSDDLFNIRSLGFRGEALASIAAVSHLRICTRPPGQLEAYELAATDDQIDRPQACAGPIGTTVEIRNLFHNVPARRKFLRRAPTEFSHATEQLARLALAHPQVAFTLTHNGRTTRNLPPSDSRRTRIGDFYGHELAECLIATDRQERGIRIEALIAPPDQSRPSAKWQYLFLNGRFITDRRIAYALREAFRGLVEHDRYPVVFIFLTADPQSFDVNVHPTKIEVRWRDAGLVQSQILAVLRETLLSHDLTPRLRAEPTADGAASPEGSAHRQRARQALADYLKSIDPTQARIEFRPPRFPTSAMRPSIASTFHAPSAEAARGDSSPRPTGDPAIPPGPDTTAGPDTQPPIVNRQSPTDDPASLPSQSVIQVHNAYIVAQTEDGIIIVDQHALHERVLYERFRERILAGPLESQGLLIPQTVEVSPRQIQAADDHQELLGSLGLELTAFGPGVLAVQGFPVLLQEVAIPVFVTDLLDKLAEAGATESEETLIHAALDMMACKAAVKAGDPLSTEEMQALLAQRCLTERPSNCPHGRPTTLQLSRRDLEKQFKRG